MWDWILFEPANLEDVARIAVRLVLAVVLSGLLGLERQRSGKAAGLRTHMLVGLGSAALTLSILEAGGDEEALSRVIQGIATGIGFVGAGAILKPETGERHVRGVTTAAGVWLTAALGAAIGAGRLWIPLIGVALGLFVTVVLGRIERTWSDRDRAR
jgi:putative Mg2+ transporter-C (MgtC) family protein